MKVIAEGAYRPEICPYSGEWPGTEEVSETKGDCDGAGGKLRIREMEDTPEDLGQFLIWMRDPHTMKYWEGMTKQFDYEMVRQGYLEGVQEQVTQCLIEYQGRPVGFCQFCDLNAAYYEVPQILWDQYIRKGERVCGIDIFLGERSCRNRGIGTECLKLLCHALFAKGADVLMIDPRVHNARAIRCYHKCGFRDCFVVPERELQDGIYHDSLIMAMRPERV